MDKNDCTRYPFLRKNFLRIFIKSNFRRPEYIWGVLTAADLAKHLGLEKISVIEFGVAGGNGLVSLEIISSYIEKIYGIEINVYGFDTGTGLTKTKDYRDLPQLWSEGSFRMEIDDLKNRLKKARLILGPVEKTIDDFINSNPSPVGFISFDMDLYSSTKDAFNLLKATTSILLPRIHCHFDDIMGFSFSDFNGERLAIAEFNTEQSSRKISLIHGLNYYTKEMNKIWTEQQYMAHIFDHPRYGDNDGMVNFDEILLGKGRVQKKNTPGT